MQSWVKISERTIKWLQSEYNEKVVVSQFFIQLRRCVGTGDMYIYKLSTI